MGRMGWRGLRVSRNLDQFLAPLPQGSEPHGGRGPLIGGCRYASEGQGTAWALSRQETAPGHRESPREHPSPGLRGSCCVPQLLP